MKRAYRVHILKSHPLASNTFTRKLHNYWIYPTAQGLPFRPYPTNTPTCYHCFTHQRGHFNAIKGQYLK